MSTRTKVASFVIYGEPASKANSRKIVRNRRTGQPMVIKSQKARTYVQAFQYQCPKLDPLVEDDLVLEIKIYYASRRPDLDESVILDAMQGLIYKNDRQVKQRHVYWGLDRENPRAEISIETLE